MRALEKKLKQRYFNSSQNVAEEILGKYNGKGSFYDIDYTDQSRAFWQLHDSLKRTSLLAQEYAYDKDSKFYGDTDLCKTVQALLQVWFAKDFHNPNWWYNDLGVPQELRAIALYMGKSLDEELREKIINRLQNEVAPEWTGTNLVWFAENIIFKGILTQDELLVRKGIQYILDEIYIAQADREGIKSDFSFAQHGMQLYNHGYGKAFINSVSAWIDVFSDTEFEFPEEKIQILIRLMVDGNLKMGRFDELDFSARGREFVRGFHSKEFNRSEYIPVCRVLVKHAKPEDKRFLSRFIENPKSYIESFNRMYPNLGFMTHNRPGFYSSFRMADKNIIGAELINGENLLGAFLSYGACIYMKDGSEYHDIFPVWDWGAVPGTTSPHVELQTEQGCRQETEFIGVLSDGRYGFAAADIKKSYADAETVHFGGRKACFFFDKQVVHLGNRLYCDAKQPYHTTLDQCYLKGPVKAGGNPLENSDNPRKIQTKEITHNGVVYRILDENEFILKNGRQTGSYTKIAEGQNVPAQEITKDIFLLTIEHGVGAADKSYEYITFPTGETQTIAKVVANHDVQAVYCDNRLCAVFHQSGECAFGDNRIRAEAGCLIMVHDNEIWVSCAQPSEITVTVKGIEKKINISSNFKKALKFNLNEK